MTRLALVSLAALFSTGCSQATPPPVADAQAAQQVGGTPAVGDQSPAGNSSDSTEVKSRFGRSLLQQLDKAEGGASEERDLIRDTIKKNDPILERALDENLHRKVKDRNGRELNAKINANNNTHNGPRSIYIPPP